MWKPNFSPIIIFFFFFFFSSHISRNTKKKTLPFLPFYPFYCGLPVSLHWPTEQHFREFDLEGLVKVCFILEREKTDHLTSNPRMNWWDVIKDVFFTQTSCDVKIISFFLKIAKIFPDFNISKFWGATMWPPHLKPSPRSCHPTPQCCGMSAQEAFA